MYLAPYVMQEMTVKPHGDRKVWQLQGSGEAHELGAQLPGFTSWPCHFATVRPRPWYLTSSWGLIFFLSEIVGSEFRSAMELPGPLVLSHDDTLGDVLSQDRESVIEFSDWCR